MLYTCARYGCDEKGHMFFYRWLKSAWSGAFRLLRPAFRVVRVRDESMSAMSIVSALGRSAQHAGRIAQGHSALRMSCARCGAQLRPITMSVWRFDRFEPVDIRLEKSLIELCQFDELTAVDDMHSAARVADQSA